MSDAQQRVLARHRSRRRQAGMVRLEVQVRRDDVELVRGIARALADPTREAQTRALLRERVGQVPVDLKRCSRRRHWKASISSASATWAGRSSCDLAARHERHLVDSQGTTLRPERRQSVRWCRGGRSLSERDGPGRIAQRHRATAPA